jgi:hypothetical protein
MSGLAKRRRCVRALAAAAVASTMGASLAGCAAVAPWDRGDLAKPHMAPDPDPMRTAMRVHIFASREAASGAAAATGGGCGCGN